MSFTYAVLNRKRGMKVLSLNESGTTLQCNDARLAMVFGRSMEQWGRCMGRSVECKIVNGVLEMVTK